jgi:hypothetical protein
MKKRSLRSKQPFRKGVFVMAGIACVVLLGLQVPRLLTGVLYSGISGAQQLEDSFQERVAYTALLQEDKTSLAAEVVRLRAAIESYAHDRELLQYLANERSALLERIGETEEGAQHTLEGIEGRIVDYRRLFNKSVIAVRTEHADLVPEIGALVQDTNGTPIGEVVDVVQGVLLVRPYAGHAEPFSVMLGVGSSTIHATAQGRGIDTVVVQVPQGVAVDRDTPVYLPGYEKPLGTVGEVVALPENAEQELYVALIGDMRAIQHVRIMPRMFAVETVES